MPFLFSLMFLLVGGLHAAGETITVVNPSEGSMSNALGLSISGTTSLAMATVRLSIDETIIAYVTSAGGNWNYSYTSMLPDGDHMVKAEIIDNNLAVLAFDINLFTVQNDPWVQIVNPHEGETYGTLLPELIYGNSSISNENVRIYVDTVLVGTFPTDSTGSWQSPFPGIENGAHVVLVELITPGPVIEATDTANFFSSNPLVLPFEAHTLQIVNGIVPATAGSGSGTGFTYNVVGTVATITFDEDFASTPTVSVIGQGTDPSLIVTSVSTTTLVVDFTASVDIDNIHFIAELIS